MTEWPERTEGDSPRRVLESIRSGKIFPHGVQDAEGKEGARDFSSDQLPSAGSHLLKFPEPSKMPPSAEDHTVTSESCRTFNIQTLKPRQVVGEPKLEPRQF